MSDTQEAEEFQGLHFTDDPSTKTPLEPGEDPNQVAQVRQEVVAARKPVDHQDRSSGVPLKQLRQESGHKRFGFAAVASGGILGLLTALGLNRVINHSQPNETPATPSNPSEVVKPPSKMPIPQGHTRADIVVNDPNNPNLFNPNIPHSPDFASQVNKKFQADGGQVAPEDK